MASEIVLKPCPCCGGHATMEHGAERSENGWVVCMECGLSTRYHHDPAEAAAEWNRRCGYIANRKDDAWRWARGIIAELAAVVRAECEGEKYHVTLLADADSIVSSDPQSTVHNGDCVPQTERNAAHEAVDDVIESMERFASRHWMHDEGQNAREFAARLKAALKRERAAFDCECAGVAELAAKEEAARHKPAWQALARIGNAMQQKMESSPCSVTEHERAIMNLCMRTFAEQSHRQQLEDKLLREALAEIAKVADDWERHSNTKAGALDSIYELANAALSALKGGAE